MRVAAACDAAVAVLLAARGADGSWEDLTEVSGGVAGLCLIGLRAAGGRRDPGADELEAHVLRRLLRLAHPDGGFPPYPGAPSSTSDTRAALLALRLALGDGPSAGPAAGWQGANGALPAALSAALRAAAVRADAFLARTVPATDVHAGLSELLVAWTGAAPADCARARQVVAAAALAEHFVARRDGVRNRVFTRFQPALEVLSARACSPAADVSRWVRAIRERQDEAGGWLYNAPLTALNAAALVAGGASEDDAAVRRAREHLRACMRPVAPGERGVDAMRSDLWNTSLAVLALEALRGRGGEPADVRASVEHLLRWQDADGGWAWASGARGEADNDSTALVVRALIAVQRRAAGELAERLDRAVRAGLARLRANQGPHGGWSVWERSLAPPAAMPPPPALQVMRDVPTPDLTARVLLGLAQAGAGLSDEGVQAALRLLLSTQRLNGGWWCRWWAGYLPGTAMGVEALAALGAPEGPEAAPLAALRREAAAALARAHGLLLATQNPDGGWGETVAADVDASQAGRGPSTPLHTACVLAALVRSGVPAQSPACRTAVAWLLEARAGQGRWTDLQATFTLYAGATYYPFPFAALVLPLDALLAWLAAEDSGAAAR